MTRKCEAPSGELGASGEGTGWASSTKDSPALPACQGYGSQAPALVAKGYQPIPLVPRQKYPAVKGWRTTPIKESWVEDFPHHGTGLRLGHELDGAHLVAVDFDILDPEAAPKALRIADVALGPAPTRVGLPPKALRLYRITGGPVTKRTTPLWLDYLGQHNRVEILAEGQQAVVDGIHPEGPVYQWDGDIDAPKITPEQLAQFMAELDVMAEESGWTVVEAGHRGGDPVDWKPPVQIETEELRDELNRLNPDCSHGDWIRYGMALHHQYDGGDEGFALWDEWSAKGDKYPDEGELRTRWKSFHPDAKDPVTVRSILEDARKGDFPDKRATRTGLKILGTARNVRHLLGQMGVTLGFDVHRKTDVIEGIPPSHKPKDALHSAVISEADIVGLPRESIPLHLEAIAAENRINRVRDYLQGVQWDGTPRFAALGASLGINDLETRMVRRFFIQACAAGDEYQAGLAVCRGARPMAQYVLVLIGDQGLQKSALIGYLLPPALRGYYRDGMALGQLRPDDVKHVVSAWITELSEIRASMRNADEVKAFLSRGRDIFREAYARGESVYARTTIFIGTVNDRQFLTDMTGNRRYWPVTLGPWTPPEDVDQLWAEAWHAYSHGEQWWPIEAEEAELALARVEHEAPSPTEERLAEAFNWGEPAVAGRILTRDVMAEAGIHDSKHSVRPIMECLWLRHGAVKVRRGILYQGRPIYRDGGPGAGWLTPPLLRSSALNLWSDDLKENSNEDKEVVLN